MARLWLVGVYPYIGGFAASLSFIEPHWEHLLREPTELYFLARLLL